MCTLQSKSSLPLCFPPTYLELMTCCFPTSVENDIHLSYGITELKLN